ncbi:hypothetical protein LBMAG24_19720 [Bacteroidota bacterium]|nr:hypothetical protein LBMAG24_19720 [Bacteroidota bacterium]
MKENTTGIWKNEEQAEFFLNETLQKAYKECPSARNFADLIHNEIAIRLRDIIDHITFSHQDLIPGLEANGWKEDGNSGIYRNESGIFPAFIYEKGTRKVAFKVEFIDDFLKANNLHREVLGQAGSQLRMAEIFSGKETSFWAVERHGTKSFSIEEQSEEIINQAQFHQHIFRTRQRLFDDVTEGLENTENLVHAAVEAIGADWACDLFLRAEREYWMSRNRAGRVQKERQDKFGMGWANQDHHTFDSSRQYFYRTIRILEKLGFECRELFYAGAGAGWGSQILEQPVLQSVIFADIDLAPEELDIDFAHDSNIKPLYPYRRAGLWCAMHGESILEAGLNHLECMFDAKRFNEIFARLNIDMMQPFSDFPHLYQALTVGEWWSVDPKRIAVLEAEGHITEEEAEDFRKNGLLVLISKI